MSEQRTHFAWPNTDVICAECSWMMRPIFLEKKLVPGKNFRRLVECYNELCTKRGIVFEIPIECALKLLEYKPEETA